MKISNKYKVRDMAGQHVVIIQGKFGEDMTKIISLNDTSLFLWNKFSAADFSASDVAEALVAEYQVDEETASRDAAAWCGKLKDYGLLSDVG